MAIFRCGRTCSRSLRNKTRPRVKSVSSQLRVQISTTAPRHPVVQKDTVAVNDKKKLKPDTDRNGENAKKVEQKDYEQIWLRG